MNSQSIFFIIFMILVYFMVIICVFLIKKTKKLNFYPFPKLILKKNEIVFNSHRTHRFRIENVKTMLVENVLYIKQQESLVIINNVKDVKIFENNLYFTALGKVKILFNNNEFYKYFSLKIDSEQFNLNELKQQAIVDLMNNNFNIKFSKTTKKYIKIIKNVLNINIFSKKIIIKSNKFKFSFILTYKLNNKIKQVYVNQTL